ncbi:PucR family transcriptional regulator [Patulibacter defluvii]|uniref:PucR family transcriptional regulator n=1 Tax=Patulibacter defluvii TaxID=3095358 RepID=UPI002A752061|nr:helix-turn-helix domain-containing protein [Patulibacter sp. DM4]
MSSTAQPPPTGDGERAVPPAARALADEIDGHEMARVVFDRIVAQVFPARTDDEAFLDALRQSVTDNVVAVLDVIAGRLRIASAEPLGAIALMDVMASVGEPTSAVERGYRIGQWEIWEQWFQSARRRAAAGDVDLEELLVEPSRALFGYIDTVLGMVLQRYDAQRLQVERARDHRRTQALRRLLAGSGGEPAELRSLLQYDLSQEHRAVVVRCDDRAVVEPLVARLAAALGARETLLHADSLQTWTIWLGRRSPAPVAQLRAFRRQLDAAGLVGGVSEPATGLAGVRRTHQEARRAMRVAEALGDGRPGPAWFVDVQLEALLVDDPIRAAAFVDGVLGPLAGTDERATRLRETVAAWVSSGSHVGAAALQEVHEHTIRNRLKQAEEALGHPIGPRRTELAVALRLRRLLAAAPAAVSSPPARG